MAKKAETISYETIMHDIEGGNLKPVYLLMGEENYFIDQIAEAIVTHSLKEEERDFNLNIFYGMDADMGQVIGTARSFPMGADHTVVILKEAQHARNLEEIAYYLDNIQPQTILIIIYRGGTVDQRKKFVTAIQRMGIVFNSQKPREEQLPTIIKTYLNRRQKGIDAKTAFVIAESIGSDLNRLFGELNKLITALPDGQSTITPELAEEHIGISREYNYFELQAALITKNAEKAQKILNYFDKNPKAGPIQMVISLLFSHFSKCMIAYYSPDKSERGIAEFLHSSPWMVQKSIMPTLKNYSARKVLNILDEIRNIDRKSKGGDGCKVRPEELLKQLIFFILH